MTEPRKPNRIEEDLAPISDDELAAAQRLRDALDDPSFLAERLDHDLRTSMDLIGSLREAVDPTPIAPDRHEKILAEAMGTTPLRSGGSSVAAPRMLSKVSPPRRRRLATLLSAGGAISLAAAVFLPVTRLESPDETASLPSARRTPCRSAADLFDERFPVTGGTSARVDRIALARERDLRDNLFETWRVR